MSGLWQKHDGPDPCRRSRCSELQMVLLATTDLISCLSEMRIQIDDTRKAKEQDKQGLLEGRRYEKTGYPERLL